MARNYSWNPAAGLGRTRGSLPQRLRINAALYLLSRSRGGSAWANLLITSGTGLGFGGDKSALANATVTWDNEIQIHPGEENGSVEGLAAVLAHEAVHVERQTADQRPWPWTGEREEDRAYRVEYEVWQEVRWNRSDLDWLAVNRDPRTGDFYSLIRDPNGPYYYQVFGVPMRKPWVGD